MNKYDLIKQESKPTVWSKVSRNLVQGVFTTEELFYAKSFPDERSVFYFTDFTGKFWDMSKEKDNELAKRLESYKF